MRSILGLFLLLASCSSEVPEPTGKTKDLAGQSTDFAFKLHGEMLRQNAGKNVFISPTSVLFALSMAASGARGATSDEMLAVLQVKGWSREDLDSSNAALLQWLKGSEPQVRLEVANSAWLRNAFQFEPRYVKELEKNYGAKATLLDFNDPKSLDIINQWVKERTQGKILTAGPTAFDPLDRMVLINAVYFKGAWEKKFDPSKTQDQPFHLGNGKTKTLPFMKRTARLGYLEAKGFQSVRIPYGEKQTMAFWVFLPKEGVTLLQLHDQLQASGREAFSAGVAEVTLELPRFKLQFDAELTPVLQALGMKRAFTRSADFSGMARPGGEQLLVSRVYHKTFVDVNEEGTEAAASTTVTVKAASAERRVVLRVDRPFFCAIVDDKTGSILFMGSIVDPQ